MKVLEIMGSLHRGGAETMIMNYYRAFDKELCQMDFVIHKKFDDDYCNEAKENGAFIILLERPGEIGIVRYIRTLLDVIRKYGPYEAIHIHTNYQAFLSVIAARIAGVKNIIVHSHTTAYTRNQLFINRLIFRICKVRKLSCGKLAGDAFFGTDYTIVRNAIPVSGFNKVDDNEVKKIRDRFHGRKIIGHLGSFVRTKNHAFMLALMEEIKKSDPTVCLLLYGDGELKDEIKHQIKNKNLQDNVYLMGVTSSPNIVYHAMDVFILPSLYEGFPVTLVEAQLSGTYALASNTISKECNIGISNIEFLELDKFLWANRIMAVATLPKCTQKTELNVDEYNVDVQWKKLYKIYKNDYE